MGTLKDCNCNSVLLENIMWKKNPKYLSTYIKAQAMVFKILMIYTIYYILCFFSN